MKAITLFLISLLAAGTATTADGRPPNIVIIFTDDLAYGDIEPFRAEGYATPHLARMAAEGTTFTDFYVSAPVCSASRAALLTGCYHERVGISGALGPGSRIGLHQNEVTIAELCKQKDYATAIFGKWHLGHQENFLPANHGFDEFFGIPYSNDMWPFHPEVLHLPMEQRLKRWPHLPLIEGTDVINPQVMPEDQEQLTVQITERALDFIDRNKHQPFFLYVAHPQPHVPLFVSEKFAGKPERGLFGDVIAEIDWSTGEILKKLKQHGIDEHTLVIFTSDNGPWLNYGTHAGTAGPLREGKGTCWDGGVRVPFLARWPGKIPPGSRISEPAATIDLLPTIARLIDAELPDHKIDGKDIWPLLSAEEGAVSPHDALFFYYHQNELQAMRSGKWKLILPHQYRSLNGREGRDDGMPVRYDQNKAGLELYNLHDDIGESRDLAETHPEVVAQLMEKVDVMRADLGDRLTGKTGSGCRGPGRMLD